MIGTGFWVVWGKVVKGRFANDGRNGIKGSLGEGDKGEFYKGVMGSFGRRLKVVH